jgi:outer membrane protein assembly factor BamA
MHLVNIVGRIQPERLGELWANLGGLGLKLPQFKLFGTSQIEVDPEKSGDKNRTQPLAESRTEKSILTENPNTSFASTHFVDREGHPINEVRIQGNQKVSAVEIRRALEMGPDNIDNAIKLMKSTLPLKKVDWRIHEEKERRIATITVVEKGLVDTKFNMRGAFNRVDGLRLGPTVEWLRQPDIDTPPRGKLFGDLTYGFSNKIWNYTLGAQTGGGILHRMNLTFTAQIHRLTAVRDKDVLPSDGEQFFMAFLYGGDLRDYYLRDGSEVSLRWQTETAPHSLTLAVLDEEHQSLEKSTDWSLLRRDAIKDENPQITPGHLRTAALRYDFDTRSRREGITDGWYYTFDAEHSSKASGADFDFTRFQVHLRRYLRIHGNSLNGRLKFGISTGALPIQRQFFLGGPGTLGGYGLYEFAGTHTVLLNLEYRPHLLGTSFTLFFADIGNVWERFAAFDANDLKVDMGVGLIVGDEEAGFRLSLVQALELGRRPQFNVRWSRTF